MASEFGTRVFQISISPCLLSPNDLSVCLLCNCIFTLPASTIRFYVMDGTRLKPLRLQRYKKFLEYTNNHWIFWFFCLLADIESRKYLQDHRFGTKYVIESSQLAELSKKIAQDVIQRSILERWIGFISIPFLCGYLRTHHQMDLSAQAT